MLLFLFGVISFLIMLVLVSAGYAFLARKYDLAAAGGRTQQVSILLNYLLPCAIVLGAAAFFLLAVAGICLDPEPGTLLLLIGSLGILLLLMLALTIICLRCASYLIGVLVFADRGTFSVPRDVLAATFTQNFLHLQIIWGWAMRDELPLREITKITRESAVRLYIHGPWGSAKVVWRSKQKRDECIYMLERATKRHIAGLDLE